MKVVRLHLASVPSTNTYAKENLAKFTTDALTVITADEQTAGRGRLSRQWVSTKQDITATFVFRLPKESLQTAYQLSPLLAVAVRRALRSFSVDSDIKWPNDIVVKECKKVGGILCEMDSHDGEYWAALGIGLNVNSQPDELALTRPVWPASTLKAECPAVALSVPALTDALVSQFHDMLVQFQSSGFLPFLPEYKSGSILMGKRITFAVTDEQQVQGTVVDISPLGHLVVQHNGRDEPTSYLSGEVTGIQLVPEGAPGPAAMR